MHNLPCNPRCEGEDRVYIALLPKALPHYQFPSTLTSPSRV